MTSDLSLPLNSTAVFAVSVWGTPPLTLQWYHNGLPLSNSGHYSGVNTPTLTITPLSYTNAGAYYLAVSNACGGTASMPARLTITKGWPWSWGWWNFAQIGRPLVATVGPDLIISGTNTLGISSGTTLDFGLPNIGGQIANVMHVSPLPGDALIQLPFIAPASSNSGSSYTLIMDVYAPSNSTARATLFDSLIDGLSGQDRISLSSTYDGAGASLRVGGNVGGTPVNLVSQRLLPAGTWNRVALVVIHIAPDPSGTNIIEMTLSLYLNGKPAGSAPGISIHNGATNRTDYILATPQNAGESYVSSIQFHGVAMTPEMIAGIGFPDDRPIRANDTSVGVSPVLSANISNGAVKVLWIGSTFLLQETRDLTRGAWMDSLLPFDQTEMNGEITTTVYVNPYLEIQVLLFRLKYSP
jgi:hypothetical protein